MLVDRRHRPGGHWLDACPFVWLHQPSANYGVEPDLMAWNEGCRLNPARGAVDHLDDTRVADAFASMMTNTGRALRNLEQRATGAAARNRSTAAASVTRVHSSCRFTR